MISLNLMLLLSACSSNENTIQAQATTNSSQARLKYIEVYGNVSSNHIQDIFINFQYKINKIYCKNGERVKKGDKLITINTDEYQLQINKAQEELDSVKALGDTTKDQKTKIDNLQTNVDLMLGQLTNDYLNNNNIICDFNNAVVAQLDCSEGEELGNEKKLLTLYDADSFIVKANVSEDLLNYVKLNKEVSFVPMANKSKRFKGNVQFIGSVATSQNGVSTVPVEISISNPDNSLIAEQTMDIQIPIN